MLTPSLCGVMQPRGDALTLRECDFCNTLIFSSDFCDSHAILYQVDYQYTRANCTTKSLCFYTKSPYFCFLQQRFLHHIVRENYTFLGLFSTKVGNCQH